MGKLEGKTAVITGGSSNIGLEIGRRFAAEGAQVVIAARDGARLEQAVDAIGHGATGVSVDVADEAQVKALFEPLERVDLLVTCAGGWVFGAIDELPPQRWVELFAGRFFGQMYACHYAVPKMPAGGSIMLCSGIAAKAAIPNYAGGSALCGAVNSLGRQLALELAPRDIRVNVLSPGLILSPEERERAVAGQLPDDIVRREFINSRIPLKRPGGAEDMADAAMFLAGCNYATGMVMDIDGGWTTL
ncbi:2-(R)-hydroxypropyl-CoM dehydrogenase [Azoarcus sp. Aa7]|nr:2-(R)-hydroxypropyl-CoM dehydrogenase [Azoarcus sp. Aa7]